MKNITSTGTHGRSGKKLAAISQAFIFLLCFVCATLALGAGTAHAANRTLGQLAGGTGSYSDGNTISFGKTFTAAPVVVVNAHDASGNPLAAAADGVSTTGFTVRICNSDGYAVSNATVQWVAIIPDPNNPKVKAGYGFIQDGYDISYGHIFNSNPIVLGSAYGRDGLDNMRPFITGFTSINTNRSTVVLKDVFGIPVEGNLSWIAIEPGNPPDMMYDEAVLACYTLTSNSYHVYYGYPMLSYAQADNPVVLAFGLKDGNAYCTSSYNNSSTGFDLGFRDYDGAAPPAGTMMYSYWAAFYLNPPGTHMAIFYKNDGSSLLHDIIYTDASNHAALPTNPTRSGYHFAEWNTQNDGHGNTFTASTTVTEDVTAYAIWTPNNCTVNFDKNGGDTDANPASKAVTNPATTVGTLPSQPSRSGYSFAGWNTAADGSGYAFTASTILTATPTTVYAMWTPDTYTVTFDKNGGDTDASPATRTVTTPATTVGTLPAPPTRSGYHFTGWNTKDDGSGSAFTASTAVTGNITVYAMWTPIYTVTFDKNGGDTDASPKTAATDANGHVTLPSAPARAGYDFTGWNTKADGSGAAFISSTIVASNITVYAQWKESSCTVLFDPQNGSGASGPTVSYGSAIQAPAQPSKSGYNFTGWYTPSGGLVSFPYTVTQNITLYAGWSPQPQSNFLAGATPSSGQLSPAFNKTRTSYSITVGEYDSNFTLTPIKEFDGAVMTINGKVLSSYPVNLDYGKSTKITVKVTHAKKSKTYTFTVTRPKSSNNALSSLGAAAGTWSQPFDPGVLNYTLTLDENTKSTTIKAISAMGKLSGVSPSYAKVTLNNGAYKDVKITVKAQSGAKRVYNIRVQRAASTNADLKSLKAAGKGCAMNPVFSAGQTSYTVNMPAATGSVTINAKALGFKAAVSIDGGKASKNVTVGSGASVTVRIVVTAQAGNSKEYLIAVTRPPLPAQ